MLKVIVACDNCGTLVELKPINKQDDYTLMRRELLKEDLYIKNVEVTDKTLESMRIHCANCDDYIDLKMSL